jgi:hypothetical protein
MKTKPEIPPKKLRKADVKVLIKKNEKLKSKKSLHNRTFQLIGENINMQKVNFTANHGDATSLLNEDIYDSSAPKAAKKMAAQLIGMLWQSGGKSVLIDPPKKLKDKSKEVSDYYTFMGEQIAEAFDNPRGGFSLALEEYMEDQVSFGTSGIHSDKSKDSDVPVVYRAIGIDNSSIAEGPDGRVDTVFTEESMSVENAIKLYTFAALSKEVQEKYTNGKCDEEILILHAIEPRIELDPDKRGNKNMPFKSVHIEVKTGHLIKESGFEEFPCPVARMYKRRKQVYGYSPASQALPDTLTLNQIKMDRLLANEKRLEPPLGVMNDAVLGGGQIDTSARGITVFKPSGQLGQGNPVFQLYTVGDVGAADEEIQEYKQSINEHFANDRLLDFNSDSEMTLGEAEMRFQIRGQSLVPLFMRQIVECFTPCVERTASLLYRDGRLGVIRGSDLEKVVIARGEEPVYIPEAVAKLIANGKDFYEVKYLTPAARLMQTEEARGVMRTWESAFMIAKVKPSVMDLLDEDESLRIVASAWGMPSRGMKDKKTVEDARKQLAAAAEKARKTMDQENNNTINKGAAEADLVQIEAEKKAAG